MIMKMVRPQKVLYMAVDGVAPRAKMNQQRSRRFRASQESQEKAEKIKEILNGMKSTGVDVESFASKNSFDSNVITPGTQFMINLSASLRKWIDEKLSPDYEDREGIWPKDLVVILSDASVPGEGEHKIMDYIRKQKAKSTYDYNLSHCLLGADADLIMLGLATHELNFTILREEFVPNQPRPCDICSQYGHTMDECGGDPRDPNEPEITPKAPGFIFIRLNILREYLEKEADGIDLERFIDDFVFLCFFVGNDFLPHLPSLEIREGAIDRLINIYRDVMRSDPNRQYLTQNGIVNLKQVQKILTILGQYEDNIFKQRKESDERFKQRQKRQKQQNHQAGLSGWLKPDAIGSRNTGKTSAGLRQEAQELRLAGTSNERLKAMVRPDGQETSDVKRKAEEVDSDSDDNDEVQLGMEGWKERYYFKKFDCALHTDIAPIVAREYVIGLCWVLLYYYQGCPDWQWFYPYHYAPFASDFRNIDRTDVNFNRDSKPFKPLEQLMSVFPAGSAKNLPPSWRKLMTDSKSSIIDFYPTQFTIDLNGKKAAWMGVALLPFIDEQRLHLALKAVYDDLTEEEKERNSLGPHLMFISRAKQSSTDFMKDVISFQEPTDVKLAPEKFDRMSGTIRSSRFTNKFHNTFCVEYYDPHYDKDFVFPAIRHPNAKAPSRVLKEDDYVGQFRPTIGFTNNGPRASLGQAGHRMIQNGLGGGSGFPNYSQGYGGGSSGPWSRGPRY